MKEIGGYFELELPKGNTQYHDTPYVLKSGRISLQYILTIVKPTVVYIPFFSCRVLLEPFKSEGVAYKFYEINDALEPAADIALRENEYFLYINYFDLKRETVAQLSEKYKDKLIVDNTNAFFMKGNGISWFFNSCRKFFGVPDGAYIYSPAHVQAPAIEARNETYTCDHLLKRFNGYANDGYESFLKNEVYAGYGISAMSRLSEYLLSNVDYEAASEKRRTNYFYLHHRLKSHNLLHVTLKDDGVPLFYPLLINNLIRPGMIDNKIYLSVIWPHLDPSLPADAYERFTADHLLPLPVDHRYDTNDMQRILDVIFSLIK